MPLPERYKLFGKHYIANISVDSRTASGLQVLSTDPRKWRFQPDAYVGKIEEVGPRCELVKPGDLATIERWRWLQLDLDDERICGSESHLLLVNGVPCPGILVIELVSSKLEDQKIILPQTYRKPKSRYFFGRIIATGDEDFKLDDFLWIQKADRDQWKLDEDKIIFRSNADFILVEGIRQKVPQFEVVG